MSGNKTHTLFDGGLSSRFSTNDFSLVVVDGPHKGQELRLEQELIRIGRTDWCDLCLADDQWVSNIHCECWLDEKGLRIRDRDSRNGILIDGCQVFDAYLREGVEFQVGTSTIQVKSHHRTREITISYHDKSETLVGKSPKIRKLFSILPRLAERSVSTLLTGETGCGKSTVARAIHMQSPRADQPFVAVNCGTFPPNLIESVLFGHEKGAFTGAEGIHKGLFEQANGGTLFLDEIAELPLDLQPKLLDVLENRKVRRLGGQQEYEVDFHLISATLRHLPTEILEKRFREDLYFRLAVIELEVPPLRERMEDLPLLIEKLMQELGDGVYISFSKEALQKMQGYLWPGNIRELRNTLERSLVFLEGETIQAQDILLPQDNKREVTNDLASLSAPSSLASPSSSGLGALLPTLPLMAHKPPKTLKDVTSDVERGMIEQALQETERNVQEAANLLDVSAPWLYARIRKFNLKTKNKRKGE